MSLFWLALIGVVAWIGLSLLHAQRRRDDVPLQPIPEDILAGRLARGEIDVETYDELRAKLQEARLESSIIGARRER